MEKFKAILSKIKYYRVIMLSLSIILLIVGIVMRITVSYGSNKYADQTVAKRWDKEGNYAHVSLFIKDIAHFNQTTLDGLKYNLDEKLDFNSIEVENEDARRFIECHTAKSFIYLEGPSRSMQIDCLAVGGDFFVFHPIKMINGSYFDGNDLMQDGIILDEESAWQLFGSSDVVGKTLYYGDRVLYVKGVYEREENKLFNYARGDRPEIFVPFDLLDSAEAPLDITCVEICMPNPVKNFATGILDEISTLDSSTCETVENSSRYTVENLWVVFKNKKYRSMQNHDIIYPYWEKIARYEEDILAPKAVVMVVSFVSSAVIFLALLLYEISKLTRLKSRNDD